MQGTLKKVTVLQKLDMILENKVFEISQPNWITLYKSLSFNSRIWLGVRPQIKDKIISTFLDNSVRSWFKAVKVAKSQRVFSFFQEYGLQLKCACSVQPKPGYFIGNRTETKVQFRYCYWSRNLFFRNWNLYILVLFIFFQNFSKLFIFLMFSHFFGV